MADPCKWQGTGEFLRLSLLGLLHRSSDKGCSREPQAHRCPQTRGGSLSPGCSSYLKRKLPQRSGERCRRRPLRSTGPRAQSACTLGALPAGAQRCGSTSQGRRPEEGPAHFQNRAGKGGDPGHIAAEHASGMTLPPSSPHSLLLMVTGELQLVPQTSFAGSAASTTDTWAPEGSCPALSIHSSRGTVQWELSLSWLLPSKQGKSRKGIWASARAHWSDSIGTESIAHANKAGEWHGTMFRKNQFSYNSCTWNRSTKMMMFLLLQAMDVFPL